MSDFAFLYAPVLAAVATFVLGGIWYGPLFGKTWLAASGLSEEDVQDSHPAKTFGIAFVSQLIAAFALSFFLSGADLMAALRVGTYIGLGIASTALATNYVFEQKSMKLFLVNAGYISVGTVLMAVIIAALL